MIAIVMVCYYTKEIENSSSNVNKTYTLSFKKKKLDCFLLNRFNYFKDIY